MNQSSPTNAMAQFAQLLISNARPSPHSIKSLQACSNRACNGLLNVNATHENPCLREARI
jgi:hypothetical protein